MRCVQDENWYKRNNAVDQQPWVWCDGIPLGGRIGEVVSYPWYDEVRNDWFINVRTKVGDPTSMKTFKAKYICCFAPSSHQDFYDPKTGAARERIVTGDNSTAFYWTDELDAIRAGADPAQFGYNVK